MEGESNLLRVHSQLATLTHAIEIREVTIDCGQTVMRFAGDLIGSFTFGMLATNDRLMGQTSADIMQGGAPRNQLLRVAFMCGQQGSDLTIMAIEQFGEIDVAQEGTLGMSLLAEANRFAAQTLLWFHSIKDGFEVLSGAEVENHRHQLRVAEALLKRWWIIKTDASQTTWPCWTMSRGRKCWLTTSRIMSAQSCRIRSPPRRGKSWAMR